MFETDEITESLQSECDIPGVFELAVTSEARGIKDDVVMDMSPIGMGGYDKSMIPFGEAHGSFVTHLIGFFRCDFSRLKGLSDLICDDVSFGLPAG